MAARDIRNIRTTLAFLRGAGEVLRVKNEIDPIYEISGLEKAAEGGPALLFEKIKGYPGVRNLGNVFSTMPRIAGIFGLDDHRKLKFACLEAVKHPLPPRIVGRAPCQEVVIDRDIDVMGTLPIIKHTERDAGRILGGGVNFIGGGYFRGGTHLSFNRTHFRGKDWASIMTGPPTHFGVIAYIDHPDERIPMTINICTPPAVSMVAGGGNVHSIIPVGADKVGIAGALQGFPVDIVKARTVDAYAIAESEWVIEGYLDVDRVWESEEAEKLREAGKAPFFPEWPGYLGRSYRFRRFTATAITHRKDRPIFFTPLAHSYEGSYLITVFREACLYEVAERVLPGLVVDVNTLHGLKIQSGIVYQVKKTKPWQEGYQKNILSAALAATAGMRLVIAVDEDVDIYNADEVLWAITSRVSPDADIIRGPRGGRGTIMQPLERTGFGGGGFEGGIGLDATVPFALKDEFTRSHYPVERIDMAKWFSAREIRKIRDMQDEYARVLARIGA